MENVERLQLAVFPNSGSNATDNAKGASIESVRVTFSKETAAKAVGAGAESADLLSLEHADVGPKPDGSSIR